MIGAARDPNNFHLAMNKSHLSRVLLALAAFSSLALARPGGVWVVDAGGTADFVDIQPAVDAALTGDTILVLPGSYSNFTIDNKSLSIAGDTAQFIRVNGRVILQNVAAPNSVTLSGLNLREGLLVSNCSGHVGIAGSFLLASGLNQLESAAAAGQHMIQDSEDVVFSHSTLQGRDGGGEPYCTGVWDGISGESAVALRNARAAFYSCEILGGVGGDSWDGSCGIFCDYALQGDGGDGVNAQNQSFVYLDDTSPQGGPRGDHNVFCWPQSNDDGVPVRLDANSSMEDAADPVLSFHSATIVRENSTLSLEVSGPSGALTWMLWSDLPKWRPFGGTLGLLHVDSQTLVLQPLGTIPASGVLNTTLTPPPVSAGLGARRLYIQIFAIDSSVGRLLGTSVGLDVLDPMF